MCLCPVLCEGCQWEMTLTSLRLQKDVYWRTQLGDHGPYVCCHGLVTKTTPLTGSESLRDYFSQFGEVVECTVMRDGATGRSRGFGFLTFKDPKTVNIVMVKEHYLDGKIVSKYHPRPFISGPNTHMPRSTPSAPSPATNRRRRPRSLSAASARKPRTTSSASTLPSSAVSSTPPL